MKRKKVTFTISEEIIENMSIKCLENCINKSKLLEKLIKKWLNE